MAKLIDPFIGLKRYEQELKRHDLYKEIKELLIKTEAYDDSGIGHEFVKQYERQLPGIITAHTGDHSFINGTPEENYNVVMEAVDKGTAIKAGVIGAILLLIYKIFSVMMNNKEFAGSDGRGTSSYMAKDREEVVTLNNQLNELIPEAQQAAATALSDPLQHQRGEAVANAARSVVTTIIEGDTTENVRVDDPKSVLKFIKTYKKFTVKPGDLFAVPCLADKELAERAVDDLGTLLKIMYSGLTDNMASLIVNRVGNINENTVGPTIDSIMDGNNSILQHYVVAERMLGGNKSIQSASDYSEALAKFDYLSELVAFKYSDLLGDPSAKYKVIDLNELTAAYLDPKYSNGNVNRMITRICEFNDEFNAGDGKKNDRANYARHATEQRDRIIAARDILKECNDPRKTEAVRRLDEYITVFDLNIKYIERIPVVYRKFNDSLNKFVKDNKNRLASFNKAYAKFLDATSSETV